MGIKLLPALNFPFIFGMVFALNMSNPTRTGLRQCFVKRQTWTWTHKTHKFIYWFRKSGGIKVKSLQEKCCPFAPVLFNKRNNDIDNSFCSRWTYQIRQFHPLSHWQLPVLFCLEFFSWVKFRYLFINSDWLVTAGGAKLAPTRGE